MISSMKHFNPLYILIFLAKIMISTVRTYLFQHVTVNLHIMFALHLLESRRSEMEGIEYSK